MFQRKRQALVLTVTAVAAAVPCLAMADPVPPIPTCVPLAPLPAVGCPATSSGSSAQPAPPSSSAENVQSASSPRAVKMAAAPAVARTLLAEVNRIRRANGLKPLASSAQLAKAATSHAKALAAAGQFTHAWPANGSPFGRWIRTFYRPTGYRSWSVGENLVWAAGILSPGRAVQEWLDSPVHRRVMLTPAWRELGVGVVSAAAAPGFYGNRDVQIGAAEFGVRRR